MLKAFVTDISKVEEQFRGLYVKVDGGYRLNVEKVDGWELTDTAALTQALERERENAKTAKNEAKAKDREIQTLQAKVAELSEADGEDRVKAAIEERERQLLATFEQEKQGLIQQVESLTSDIRESLLSRTAMEAITAEGGNPDLLEPIVRRHLRATQTEDKKWVTEVIGPDGTPRIGGTKDGKVIPMDARMLTAELKKDPRYAAAFAARASGGGADGDRRTSPSQGGRVDLSKIPDGASKIEAARRAQQE